MMTKEILFSNGEKKEMSFDQAREQFLPMVWKTMRNANNKFIFNSVEEDDFMQIMEIELWRAYEQYEPERGLCFTTYLFPKLQKGVRNATYHKYSLKNQGISVSMNAPMGDDGLKLEDMFVAEEDDMDGMEVNELTAIIRSNVSENEEELLQILLDKQQYTVQDYATKHNITRQAANQRVNKLKKKLQLVVSDQYLETSH